MTKTIPIFPLDLVLFPRQNLPLRIFEPRYKQLVDDCMLGDGQFGVCLIDKTLTVMGWESPQSVGTVAKITGCKDVELDGAVIHIDTVGRNPFRIKSIIPPSLPRPADYDPQSPGGVSGTRAGTDGTPYIRAEVEMIPEIDQDITLGRWNRIVDLWKRKVAAQALPRVIESHALDHLLEQYYLVTDTPTMDYVYSLSALGAESPDDLQPILEADSVGNLLDKVEDLLTIK